jgi:hypothetical protein
MATMATCARCGALVDAEFTGRCLDCAARRILIETPFGTANVAAVTYRGRNEAKLIEVLEHWTGLTGGPCVAIYLDDNGVELRRLEV